MAYFDCIVGGSGKGNTLVVTCADDLAGATITCTNGTKTYTKTCPSTSPYEVTFYGLAADTWAISATVSGDTYTTTVVIANHEAELGGFSWRAWVDLSDNYTSNDFTDLDDLLSDETAVRELMTIHACVDYLAGIAAASADVEQIIENDYCAKWINNRDYALDTLYANTIIKGYMDTADKYFYGEWVITDNTTTPPTWGAKGNVPIMTSNTAPYGEASIGGTVSSPAYIAFNGDVINSCVASGAQSLTYKFTNPVNVKRIKWIPYQADGSQTFKAHTVTFYGSNDNSTWTTLGSKEVVVTDKTNELTLDIQNNTDYFLYYKATPNQANAGNYTVFCSLQYYGRELSVSVPVMTSDTTPYGLAGATIESNIQAWGAFKGFSDSSSTRSGWWYVSNTAPQSFFYEFPTPMVIKGFKYENGYQGATEYAVRSSLYGSNDGGITYEKIIDVTGTSGPNVKFYFPIENAENKAYKRYKVEGVSAINWGIYSNVNFYGLDYSEKEFEEGTTKKWLYDHGVELETVILRKGAGDTQAIKEDSQLYLFSGTGSDGTTRYGSALWAANLTNYSLLRAKIGDRHITGNGGTGIVIVSSLDARPEDGSYSDNYNVATSLYNSGDSGLPNNLSLDCSSINQSLYIEYGNGYYANQQATLKELWLE